MDHDGRAVSSPDDAKNAEQNRTYRAVCRPPVVPERNSPVLTTMDGCRRLLLMRWILLLFLLLSALSQKPDSKRSVLPRIILPPSSSSEVVITRGGRIIMAGPATKPRPGGVVFVFHSRCHSQKSSTFSIRSTRCVVVRRRVWLPLSVALLFCYCRRPKRRRNKPPVGASEDARDDCHGPARPRVDGSIFLFHTRTEC
jgi:hypothetical protein